jgi:hypothetical protein
MDTMVTSHQSFLWHGPIQAGPRNDTNPSHLYSVIGIYVAGQTMSTLVPWEVARRARGGGGGWGAGQVGPPIPLVLLVVVARHVEASDELRWLAQKNIVSCYGHALASLFTKKRSVSRLARFPISG